MPAEAWPSFHCRPSTARTLLSPSASIRQTPTTFTNELASAPTVSFEKSSLSGSAAAAHTTKAVNAAPASESVLMIAIVLMVMTLSSLVSSGQRDARGAAAPPPRERDQERQRAEEPGQRERRVGDQRVARIVLAGDWRWCRYAGEAIEQRQDLAMAGRAAPVEAATVAVLDLAVGVLLGAPEDAGCSREPDGDVWNNPLELSEHIAAQIDIARVLGREVHSDDKRLAQRRQRTLVGGGE